MKKICVKIKSFCGFVVSRVKTAAAAVKMRMPTARAVLADNRAEGFVDTAVKILMAVVIGALLLAGLYLLFSGTILPTLTARIVEMFNYRG